MGGKTPAKQPRRGAVKDAGTGPERVAGGSEGGGGKERETNTKDGGDRGGEQEGQTEAEGHWGKVVEIIQTAFRDGELAEEVTWQAVVLIPKGKQPGTPPPGDTIPVTIEPFEVEDGVPTEVEEWAVKRLQNNCAGGAVKDAGTGPERVAGGSEGGAV